MGTVLGGAGRAMRARGAVAILCLVAILPIGAIQGGFFDTTRNWLFDSYQRMTPARRLAPQTIIIDIDQASLERIGQWPWPRDQLAKLVDAAGGARAIGIDIVLAEPDRLSPTAWASARPDLAPETRQALTALPSNDATLAASIARHPVVLAALAGSASNQGAGSVIPTMAVVESGSDPRPALPQFPALILPLPDLAAASRAIGIISVPVEADGVLRRMPLITKVGVSLIPDFSLALASLARGAGQVVLDSDSGGLRQIAVGDRATPTDAEGRVWVRYADPAPAPSISAYRVLEGSVDPALFRDRIVLIGVSAPGLGHPVATPLRHPASGVAIQAQLIETLLAGDALSRPLAAQGLEVLLAFGLGLSALFLPGRVAGRTYVGLFAGSSVLTAAGSFAAFRSLGLLIDWTFPIAILAGSALFALAARVRREAQMRRDREASLASALQQVAFAGRFEEQARLLADANAQLKEEAAERQRVEEQLVRAQRMDAVGQLTGGIAHDFNNLLTTVLGNLDLAVRQDLPADVRHLLLQATKAAERSARLTSHLLAFGRKQLLTIDAVDMNEMIHGIEEMLVRTLTPAITIKLDLTPDLWPTLADSAKLELALVNLVINARDATEDGGKVTVATRNIGGHDPDRPDDLVGDSRDHVALIVGDSGTGMTEEVSRRAFEPFFSTKEVGQGTGLGLSMVYGLTKQLGGTVRLETRLGLGTVISLFLPRARAEQIAATKALAALAAIPILPAAIPISSEISTSSEIATSPATNGPARLDRVLLVDDDGAVRETVAAMLRELGDDVVEAEDGDAALAILDRGEPVDIMIADIVMPGLHGPALASEARRRRPDLPVLLITGHAGDASEAIAAEKIYTVLRKPFRPDELAAMVNICQSASGSSSQANQSR